MACLPVVQPETSPLLLKVAVVTDGDRVDAAVLAPKELEISKAKTIAELKEAIVGLFGIQPVGKTRLWSYQSRCW